MGLGPGLWLPAPHGVSRAVCHRAQGSLPSRVPKSNPAWGCHGAGGAGP